MLSDEVLQVRQIAYALQLPSQSRSTTQLRYTSELEELRGVADAMRPLNNKRTAEHLDEVVLSGREVAGSRRRYRMGQGILLDYGDQWDDLNTENRIVRVDSLKIFSGP